MRHAAMTIQLFCLDGSFMLPLSIGFHPGIVTKVFRTKMAT